jgi:deoxyribodipyrimidine photo-lyase
VPGPSVPDDPRILVRCPGPPDPDAAAVVYWMQRAQRASDNPALDVAIAAGNLLGKPVVVLFVLVDDYPSANLRHYQFMLEGLRELPAALAARRAGFVLRVGRMDEVPRFCDEVGAALLVGDENPLREPERWRQQVADSVRVPFWTVDADVVVPSVLLEKEQFSAGTIRPRIHRQLEWCLRPLPRRSARTPWPEAGRESSPEDWLTLLDRVAVSARVPPVADREGGTSAARARLRAFVRHRLHGYASSRNEPARDGTSGLSPYLHFGQVGPREVALAVEASGAPAEDRQAFLEEFIVRRELAVNFVRFNPRYDRLEGCERWARATLERHRGDERPWLYPASRLESAETHDPLWNAAQRQMVEAGWMHGYLRMYWAKKILEWSATPEEAMAAAIALNDRYEIDGRDANGYAGIAWAIGGKHDRAWGPERPIFGTVRYMSLASTSRKFDSRSYIARWTKG